MHGEKYPCLRCGMAVIICSVTCSKLKELNLTHKDASVSTATAGNPTLPRPSRGNARWVAFQTLTTIRDGAFADLALDRHLQRSGLAGADRRLVTELVYGCVRRQRTLDVLIDLLAQRPAAQQPPVLRTVLQLGLYQLRYLEQIPTAAAVAETVQLAKQLGLGGLAGAVNAILRQYLRQSEERDPLPLPSNPVTALAIHQSFPDWLVQFWSDRLGLDEAEFLCHWFNQPPSIDLRINPLRCERSQVQAALEAVAIRSTPDPQLPQALRLIDPPGPIRQLPGFDEGWWMVQDSSAQLIAHLVDPQPGETVLDVCAAPGGKSTHLAELIGDRGQVIACDPSAKRLRKVQENAQRLQLKSITTRAIDGRQLHGIQADRVLVDAPCSGLGTLHRHADGRWRQSPESVAELAQLQAEILEAAATCLKPNGILVYATCTLHPAENEAVIEQFLQRHSDWQLAPLPEESPFQAWAEANGTLRIWPHRHDRDGFFGARLQRSPLSA